MDSRIVDDQWYDTIYENEVNDIKINRIDDFSEEYLDIINNRDYTKQNVMESYDTIF